MRQKRILIISYYWPPSGGVGVQRWMHFARNLKDLGWEPVVYTPDNPQFDIKDDSLMDWVRDIEVIKQPIWEPFAFFHRITGGKNKEGVKQGLVMEKSKKSWKDRLIVWIRGNLFVPDPRVFWVRPSVRFLASEMTKRGIRTMITTGPPHSMHLIGLGLKSRVAGLKWIADFRDPWSDWDVLVKMKVSGWAMAHHRKAERAVLVRADEVITVSQRLAQALKTKGEPKKNVHVVSNGISDSRIHLEVSENEARSRFVIGYYGMLNELRDPVSLWTVLEKMCEADGRFRECLEIRLGGIIAQSILDRLEKSKYLSDKLIQLGYLTHEQIFIEYKKCSILLLLLNKSDNAQWILPMKFFEYLSAGKAILSLGSPESELAEKFERRQIGVMLDFDQTEEIEAFLWANFEGDYHLNLNDHRDLLSRYSRSGQTNTLIEILETL